LFSFLNNIDPMSIPADAKPAGNSSATQPFSPAMLWNALGWGLCAVVLLGFSPRLFHFQEYIFFSLLGLAILLCLSEGKSLWLNRPLLVPFLCFVLWIAITIPFSIDPWISLKEWRKVVAQLMVFYGTCVIVQEQHENYFYQRILPVLLLGSIACYSYSLIDFWERGGSIWDRGIRAGFPKSEGADFTWLSTNALMMLPILTAGLLGMRSVKKRVMVVCGMFLALLALVFSYNRGVWLAFLAQLLVGSFLVNTRKAFHVLVIVLTVLLALGVVVSQLGLHRETFDPWTIKARWTVWHLNVSDLLEHPMTGVGYGVPIFEKRHGKHIAELKAANHLGIPDIPEKPHNWYLMIASGTGLPGLVLLLWLLTKTGTSVYKDFTRAPTPSRQWLQLGILLMVVGFSIRLLFDDSFGGSHSYLFWILVGISVVPPKPCSRVKEGQA
jgi:putative inorganic carbon (hco3(-)) transporter